MSLGVSRDVGGAERAARRRRRAGAAVATGRSGGEPTPEQSVVHEPPAGRYAMASVSRPEPASEPVAVSVSVPLRASRDRSSVAAGCGVVDADGGDDASRAGTRRRRVATARRSRRPSATAGRVPRSQEYGRGRGLARDVGPGAAPAGEALEVHRLRRRDRRSRSRCSATWPRSGVPGSVERHGDGVEVGGGRERVAPREVVAVKSAPDAVTLDGAEQREAGPAARARPGLTSVAPAPRGGGLARRARATGRRG